jgi:hypothetical protein
MKHLESDQHNRLNEVLEDRINPAEKPFFYGRREAHFITSALSNRASVHAAIFTKLARTIETSLREANRQFASYRSRHPRKNSVAVCVILNSKLREFTPEVALKAVHAKMKTGKRSVSRFPQIDAVLYFSEKHYRTLPDGRIAFAVGVYEGAGLSDHPWKGPFVDRIASAWSQMRTGGGIVDSDNLEDFELVHDIPDTMKRHEAWQLEYQRNPYMAKIPVDRLRVLFHRCIAVNSLTFLKGSWPKPHKQATGKELHLFQHLVEETNRRGLDLRMLDHRLLSPSDKAQVYAGMPLELVAMLDKSKSS